MKTTWARGHGGDYFYYACICRTKYIRADEIENQVLAVVRKHVLEPYASSGNPNIQINGGSMEKGKVIQFIRRLIPAKEIHKRNILGQIIKRIVYKDGYITIELS